MPEFVFVIGVNFAVLIGTMLALWLISVAFSVTMEFH